MFEENIDEHVDERRNQALDSQSQDGPGFGDHLGQDLSQATRAFRGADQGNGREKTILWLLDGGLSAVHEQEYRAADLSA